MLQTGQLLMERYEIIDVVGRGGMSIVYRAKDRTTRNIVAIKDIRRSAKHEDQLVEHSLMVEGKLLMQLSHPRLPKIYRLLETSDTIMLIMDYIQGESMDRILAKRGPQSVENTLQWGMQICEAFHYLHNQPTPIIYRDMKPANVILQPNGQLMLIDFGTARTQKVGVEMQADTICIGTEGFAAPEQYGGMGQSDARTDIFCLGSTLYNFVTGRKPRNAPMGHHPLGQILPHLENSPLEEIIAKCTRNDPDERYQTVQELYEDLKQASDGTYLSPTMRGKTKNYGVPKKKKGFQKQESLGTGAIAADLSKPVQQEPQIAENITREPPKTDNHMQQAVVPNTRTQNVPVQSRTNPEQKQTTAQTVAQRDGKSQTRNSARKTGVPAVVPVGLVVTVVLLLLAVVLAVTKSYTASVAVMIVSLAAAVITLILLLQSRKRN